MKLSPDDSLRDVINQYPLTVEYFIEAGYEDQWQMTMEEFARERGGSLRQVERNLRSHLERAVRPETEDCESISCNPLPFCPEDLDVAGVNQLFRLIEGSLQQFKRLLGSN